MKLSKAQQNIIDKMKKGWVLVVLDVPIRNCRRLELGYAKERVGAITYYSLRRMGVIELRGFDNGTKTYYLSDQFK
jgi:hypothetical protein